MTPTRDLQAAHTPVETLQIAIVAHAMPVWYLCVHCTAPEWGPRSQYKRYNSESYVPCLISKCMNSPQVQNGFLGKGGSIIISASVYIDVFVQDCAVTSMR